MAHLQTKNDISHSPPKGSKLRRAKSEEVVPQAERDRRAEWQRHPANKMPAELIAMICWQLLRGSQLTMHDNYEEYRTQVTSILAVAHTCKRWRHGVESAKALWGSIIDIERDSGEYLKTCIRRSKGSNSLLIRTSHPLLESWNNWQTLLRPGNIRRIKVLWVEAEQPHVDKLLQAFSAPAPSLESFHLERVGDGGANRMIDSESAITLFASQASRLKCLSINLAGLTVPRIDLVSSAFSLVHLSITGTGCCTLSKASDWVNVFAANPLLEWISLTVSEKFVGETEDDNTDDESDPAPSTSRKIPLNHLKALHLENIDITDAGNIFGSLIIPPSCTVLIALLQELPIYDIDPMVSGMSQYLHRWDSTVNYCAIRAELDDDDEFHIKFEGKPKSDSESNGSFGSLGIEFRTTKEVLESDVYIIPFNSLLGGIRQGVSHLAQIPDADMVLNLSIRPPFEDEDADPNEHNRHIHWDENLMALCAAFSNQTSILFLDAGVDSDVDYLPRVFEDLIQVTVPERALQSRSESELEETRSILFPELTHLLIYGPHWLCRLEASVAFKSYMAWRMKEDAQASTLSPKLTCLAYPKQNLEDDDVCLDQLWWWEIAERHFCGMRDLPFKSDAQRNAERVCRFCPCAFRPPRSKRHETPEI
ncbi:hypothetical protein D9613_011067 [Agrocybe pediades]|uniref:F-box domain-containing protein n=1 Tax=Agrocybe pediades TaxID=84607 RepID=A0A8H4VJC8_9AGAR|nr:hypothetical protein D9613_011067 [Agrocybe pediades]